MGYSNEDLGKIEAVLERLEKFRLPRLMDIKQRVDDGAVLNEFEIQFLEETMSDTENNKRFVDAHPEFQSMCARVIHLHHDITEKALENERKTH